MDQLDSRIIYSTSVHSSKVLAGYSKLPLVMILWVKLPVPCGQSPRYSNISAWLPTLSRVLLPRTDQSSLTFSPFNVLTGFFQFSCRKWAQKCLSMFPLSWKQTFSGDTRWRDAVSTRRCNEVRLLSLCFIWSPRGFSGHLLAEWSRDLARCQKQSDRRSQNGWGGKCLLYLIFVEFYLWKGNKTEEVLCLL